MSMYDDLDFDFEDDNFGLDAEDLKLLDEVLEVVPEEDTEELEKFEKEQGASDVPEYTETATDSEDEDSTEDEATTDNSTNEEVAAATKVDSDGDHSEWLNDDEIKAFSNATQGSLF